jgi:hypothetical protein
MIGLPKKLLPLLAVPFFLPLICVGQVGLPDKDWIADLNVYMLGSAMSCNVTIHGVTADVDMPFSKTWANLQFGGMARPTIRYRRWTVSTDVIYMGLGAAKNGVDLGYDQWLVEPIAEYHVTKWFSPYAGARYLSMKGGIRGAQGHTGSGKQSWWDPALDEDLHLPLEGKIGVRVHGDVGDFGAGSSFSRQIEPMLDWRLGKAVSLQFGYRWLCADYQTGSGLILFHYDRGRSSVPRSTSDARWRLIAAGLHQKEVMIMYNARRKNLTRRTCENTTTCLA